MLKMFASLILLFSSAAIAGTPYVTCRQAAWQKVSGDHPIYSLKEKSCVPLDVRFFESTRTKGEEYCKNWKIEAGFSDEHVMNLFSTEAACQLEQKVFVDRRLDVTRPVVATTHWGTGYLYFLDATTPYVDGEGTEHGRWLQRGENWYCSLPAQNFFARYQTLGGENFLFLEGLSLAVQKYELRGTMGNKLFWGNMDMHSPFAQVENTTDADGPNSFVISDAQGNIINQVLLTFILNPQVNPIYSCF